MKNKSISYVLASAIFIFCITTSSVYFDSIAILWFYILPFCLLVWSKILDTVSVDKSE